MKKKKEKKEKKNIHIQEKAWIDVLSQQPG